MNASIAPGRSPAGPFARRALAALASLSMLASAETSARGVEVAKEVGYFISPAFLEGSRLWAVRESPPLSRRLAVVTSTNDGDSWSEFAALPADVTELPSSVFVHPQGHLFVSEAAQACRRGRVLRVDRATRGVTVARYLDPTATIRPWGWALDATQTLFAAQYGLPLPGAPDACGENHATNVSYVLKIADGAGTPIPRPAADRTSHWVWPKGFPLSSSFPGWLAPDGAASDLHIHNLRWDRWRRRFVINAGDNPRATMTWSGIMAFAPELNADDDVLDGFTGSAPLEDALYVGDDFTAGPGGRGNSIRRLPWSGTRLGAASVVATMPAAFDTPIYDLHPTTDGTMLVFVNFDEAHDGTSVGSSGLHVLRRASRAAPFPSAVQSVYWNASTWRNNMYVAANKDGEIPLGSYAFMWGYNADPNGYSVLVRVPLPR